MVGPFVHRPQVHALCSLVSFGAQRPLALPWSPYFSKGMSDLLPWVGLLVRSGQARGTLLSGEDVLAHLARAVRPPRMPSLGTLRVRVGTVGAARSRREHTRPCAGRPETPFVALTLLCSLDRDLGSYALPLTSGLP